MADVKMAYESVTSTAKNITQVEGELETLIKTLDNLVNTLNESYSGESYEAFKKVWTETKPKMENLKEMVGKFSPALTTTVANQREIEHKSAQTMSNIGIN